MGLFALMTTGLAATSPASADNNEVRVRRRRRFCASQLPGDGLSTLSNNGAIDGRHQATRRRDGDGCAEGHRFPPFRALSPTAQLPRTTATISTTRDRQVTLATPFGRR